MVNQKTGFGHGEGKFSSSQIIFKKAQKNNVVVDKKTAMWMSSVSLSFSIEYQSESANRSKGFSVNE